MRTLYTPLCRLLDIRWPIIQAPIGSAATPALAAAVSEAGGLGMVPLTWRTPEEVGEVVRQTQRHTDKPFGVNLCLAWPVHDHVEACLQAGVRVVSLFWGDPSPHVAALHAAGALVIATVGSASEARRAAAAGVDVLVAQGHEAGGHIWSTVSTMALVPAVVDAVRGIPVVAAGGIADGRGLVAALALGAAGVWLGTRFVASAESAAAPVYKQRVVDAAETDTERSMLFDGGWPDAPHRVLSNSTVTRWRAAGRPAPGHRPGEGEVVARRAEGAPILRYADAPPLAGMTGDLDAMALYAGQSAGLVHDVLPAGEIVARLVSEATTVLQRLGSHDVPGTSRPVPPA